MKANELMIGDIVRVTKDVCIPKGTIVSIKGIDADNRFIEKHLVGSATCLPMNNEDGMTGGVWLEYLEPIPLTPEILEKNGWIKDGYFYRAKDGSYIQLGQLFEHATFSCKKDGINREVVTSPSILKYVHQLQHALRLCGIEKTIEL